MEDNMENNYVEDILLGKISRELNIRVGQIRAVLKLLEEKDEAYEYTSCHYHNNVALQHTHKQRYSGIAQRAGCTGASCFQPTVHRDWNPRNRASKPNDQACS